MHSKAEMGVGTLIVFISMLLVAAVAAGVLIQTAGSLQEKGIETGKQAQSQISTHAEIIEVSATDGRNGNLTDFNQLVKLSPGSDAIKLDQVIVTVNTVDGTATLKYRGTSGTCDLDNSNGYNSWNTESIDVEVDTSVNDFTLAEDLDDDSSDDYVYVFTDGGGGNDYLYFNLTSAGLINVSLGANIDGGSVTLDVDDQPVTNGSTVFAYVSVNGDASSAVINASVSFVVTPKELGEGYFTAEYQQQGTNYIAGTLQRGDMIKLCYEAPRAINEDEELRLNFIPKIGSSTLTEFTTPEVISTERVYLYP